MAESPTPGNPAEPVPTPTEPTAAVPAAEPVAPAAEPTPAPADPLAEFRERLARLEGENAALRAAASRPAPAAPAEWTPELIRQEFEAGRITDDTRVRLLGRLEGQAAAREAEAVRQERERLSAAADGIDAYRAQYPDLDRPGSETHRRVMAELASMQALVRANPQDLGVQLQALKTVLGAVPGRAATPTPRRIPVGGHPGTPAAGGPPAGKTSPLKDIPEDVVAEWRRMGADLDAPGKAQWYATRYWARQAARGRGRQSA